MNNHIKKVGNYWRIETPDGCAASGLFFSYHEVRTMYRSLKESNDRFYILYLAPDRYYLYRKERNPSLIDVYNSEEAAQVRMRQLCGILNHV